MMLRRGASCSWAALICMLQLKSSFSRVPHHEFIGWSGESYKPVGLETTGGITVEVLSWQPRIFVFHNLLTPRECDHLIDLAQPHMHKSKVVDRESGKPVTSKGRTSSGYFLKRGHDGVVQAIEQRLADITRLPVEHGEALHILHYQKDEKYEGHFDYFHDVVNTQNGGQRLATVLVYLTDVEEGGETVFPSAPAPPGFNHSGMSECVRRGIAFRPRRGSALLFYSLKPDGEQDTRSLHGSCPVIRGSKWSATKWIRQREYKTH